MKKFLSVLFMLLVTLYFAAPATAGEEVKKGEKGKGKKVELVNVELTGKIVKEDKKDLFVAEDGQKYFIIKGKGKGKGKGKTSADIFSVEGYESKTFKVKGTSKPLSEKDKEKKGYYPSLKIDEFAEAGAAEAKAPEAPAAPQAPAVEAPATPQVPAGEVKAPEAPVVEAPATPQVPAGEVKTPEAPEAPKAPAAEEKAAETGK